MHLTAFVHNEAEIRHYLFCTTKQRYGIIFCAQQSRDTALYSHVFNNIISNKNNQCAIFISETTSDKNDCKHKCTSVVYENALRKQRARSYTHIV
jgi:hypothetical protein